MLKAESILSIFLFISKCRCSSNPRPGRSGPAPATRALAVLSSARPGSRDIRRGIFGPVPARPGVGYRHRAAAGRGSSRPVADSESRGVGGERQRDRPRGAAEPDAFVAAAGLTCSRAPAPSAARLAALLGAARLVARPSGSVTAAPPPPGSASWTPAPRSRPHSCACVRACVCACDSLVLCRGP